MALPAGMKLELAIGTAGAFVDVSADVDGSVSIPSRIGRTSEFSAPSAGTWTVTLDNSVSCSTGQGSYTPGRQVLYDGVTAHPYYPFIIPRVQARLSYTISATKYYRAYGYVKAWHPLLVNTMVPRVQIQVADILDQLSRITFQAAPIQSVLIDSPVLFIPFNDPTGATAYQELIAGLNATAFTPFGLNSGGGIVTSGVADPVPFPDGLTGLSVAGNALPAFVGGVTAWVTNCPLPSAASTTWTLEAWWTFTQDPTTGWFPGIQFNVENSAGTEISVLVQPGAVNQFTFEVDYFDLTNSCTPPTFNVVDGLPHHYVVTGVDNGTNLTISLYFDGVLKGTATGVTGKCLFGNSTVRFFGGAIAMSTAAAPPVIFGPMSFYATALTATQVGIHHAAGTGGTGYTTSQRLTEYLRWASVPTGSQNLDTGQEIVGQHPVAGQTMLQLGQDMATTEGGGSVFYATPDSKVRFANRRYRDATTPALTVDAGADLDGMTFIPSIDDLTLINQSVVTRQGGQTFTVSNAASITANGLSAEQITAFTATDAAALRLAEQRVAAQAVPGYRLPQVSVDLMTATSAGLYAAVAAVQIGSRIRVTNLDAAASPSATLDLIVEGWTETITADEYKIVFDTSPADNPPRWIWGTSRWAPVPGAMTLNTTITNSGTTILIARSSGPPFTTTSGSYPLNIQLGAEIITLTAAPSGTTSPQTFTGCTRGTNGSFAAAQTSGAVVSLWPAYKWAL